MQLGRGLLGEGKQGDSQAAVFGPKLVDEGHFLGGILEPDLVGQAEHGAHAVGLDAHGGDFLQEVPKVSSKTPLNSRLSGMVMQRS